MDNQVEINNTDVETDTTYVENQLKKNDLLIFRWLTTEFILKAFTHIT